MQSGFTINTTIWTSHKLHNCVTTSCKVNSPVSLFQHRTWSGLTVWFLSHKSIRHNNYSVTLGTFSHWYWITIVLLIFCLPYFHWKIDSFHCLSTRGSTGWICHNYREHIYNRCYQLWLLQEYFDLQLRIYNSSLFVRIYMDVNGIHTTYVLMSAIYQLGLLFKD